MPSAVEIVVTERPLRNKSETVAVAASVASLTAANYANARQASIQVQTDEIRFWLDGTTPTATSGFLAAAGDMIELNSQNEIAGFRAIRSSGASQDAALAVSYFG